MVWSLQMMKPVLDQLKSQVGDSASIIKVDIDKNQPAAAAFNVQSVPTLILFKKGKPVWRQSGVVQAAQLKQVIDQHA